MVITENIPTNLSKSGTQVLQQSMFQTGNYHLPVEVLLVNWLGTRSYRLMEELLCSVKIQTYCLITTMVIQLPSVIHPELLLIQCPTLVKIQITVYPTLKTQMEFWTK